MEERVEPVIVDGEHIVLECSSCGEPLVDIWQTRTWGADVKVRAKCYICSDMSFVKTIPNGFHYGPAGKAAIKNVQMLDNYTLFETVKGENHEK